MEIKIGDTIELNHDFDYITVKVIDIDANDRGLLYIFKGNDSWDLYAYKNQIRKVNGKRV